MPNYYIRADGLSRTKQQLMTMLENQEYPQEFSIVGLIDEQNPESQAWYFDKSFDGQGYNYNQQQVVFHGLPAVGANQFEGIAGIAELVEECIAFFGPDAVAVNAPPLEELALPELIEAPAANNQGAAPMNLNDNMFNDGWGAQPQQGGRRRRNATHRRSSQRRAKAVTRRKVTRRKVARRRVSQHRRL
jgi:hypothetical protein